MKQLWGDWWKEPNRSRHDEAIEAIEASLEPGEHIHQYELQRLGSLLEVVDGWWDGWQDGFAMPSCSMVKPGRPITITEAERQGLEWSKECAKRLGLIGDTRDPMARVSWRGSRHAYMHLLDCEVCQLEGVAKCPVFPLVATEQVESDVDPRLDDLLAPERAA